MLRLSDARDAYIISDEEGKYYGLRLALGKREVKIWNMWQTCNIVTILLPISIQYIATYPLESVSWFGLPCRSDKL